MVRAPSRPRAADGPIRAVLVSEFKDVSLYTGGAAIAVPLPVLLILSLPMAGQREELYSLKGATLPYRYAHPDTVVVDQQLLH